MNCPECQHEYADRIPKCPYCGGLGLTPSFPEEEESGITIYYENLALKTAGFVLLLNAAAVIAIALINMMKTGEKDFIGFSSIIDILLGIAILYGSSYALLWTKIRAILGLIFVLFLVIITKNYFLFAIQALYCISLLVLIADRPKKLRIILSFFFFVIYFAIVFLSLFLMVFMVNK